MKRLLRSFVLASALLMLLPALAYAGGGPLGFQPSIETWALVLGAITPLFTYVLNHFASWTSEQVKGTILLVVSGVVGAIYAAIEANNFGWNDPTVSAILAAILGAFGAHALVYKPAGWNVQLGGGSNAGGE